MAVFKVTSKVVASTAGSVTPIRVGAGARAVDMAAFEAGDPLDALADWLSDYDRSAQHCRGMRAVMSEGIAITNSRRSSPYAPR